MMDETELRALVRQAIRHHLEQTRAPEPRIPEPRVPEPRFPLSAHPSHLLLNVASGRVGAGPCLVEPQVLCEHCRFCQSYGH